MDKNPKALFICGSTHHLSLFNNILEKLDGWNSIFYITKIESTLMSEISNELDLNYAYVPQCDKNTILNILNKENPDIVVTYHDQTPLTKLFIKNANSMSIPTLMVQDGLYNFNFKKETYVGKKIYNRLKFILHLPFQLFRFLISNNSLNHKISTIFFELRYGKKGKRTIYGQGESKKIAVFGNSTKEFLVSIGVNPDKIVITGSPKFDPLYDLINKKDPINNNSKKVLVLTQPLVEAGIWTTKQRDYFFESIFESVDNIGNIELIFKLHPKEKKDDYKKIIEIYPKNVKILKDIPLHDLIYSSDLAITIYSTAGLEAMILKKPLVILNLFDDFTLPIFQDLHIAHITKKEDIEKTIKTFLYDSNKINELFESYKGLYNHTYKIDGKASIRIASLMNQMIE